MNWILRSNKITSFLLQTSASGVKMIPCFVVRQKDGVVISTSGRVAITSGGRGDGGVIHSLSISKVESSDAGKYTVRAFNDFGESRFTATVLVKGWQSFISQEFRNTLTQAHVQRLERHLPLQNLLSVLSCVMSKT